MYRNNIVISVNFKDIQEIEIIGKDTICFSDKLSIEVQKVGKIQNKILFSE